MKQKEKPPIVTPMKAAKDLNHFQDSTSALLCQVMQLCHRINTETEHYACLQYGGTSTMAYVYRDGYRPQKAAEFLPRACIGEGYQEELRVIIDRLKGYLEVGHAG